MPYNTIHHSNSDMKQIPHPPSPDAASNLSAAYVNTGNDFAHKGNLQLAVKYYYAALKESPDSIPALFNLGTLLYEMGDIDQAITFYEQAITLNPQFAEGLCSLGKAVRKKGKISDAIHYFQKAIHVQPNFSEAKKNLNHINRSVVPLWHFAMMNDTLRNKAYEKAIAEMVTPDSIVLDIGTGSGLLAMFAARAGAKKVYSCERIAPIAEKANEIIASNGFADVITVLNKDSRTLEVGSDLTEKADILVSEIFDVGLLGEGIIATVDDAFKRLLKADAVSIPKRAKIYGALIESQKLIDYGRVFNICGFNLSKFNELSTSSYFQAQLSQFPHRLMSDVFEVFDFDFKRTAFVPQKRKIPITVKENGICHGVAFWFDLDLTGSVHIDIGPESKSHWNQAVQLLAPAVELKSGQDVLVLAKHDCTEVSFNLGLPRPSQLKSSAMN